MRKGQKLPKNRISVEDSVNLVLGLLAHAPTGYKYDNRGANTLSYAQVAAVIGRMYLRWDLPAWGVDASLDLHWEGDGDGEYFKPTVQVSWGSTHYTPAAAVAAARLHREVAEFACLLEHHLRGQPPIICHLKTDLPSDDVTVATKSDY